MPDVFAYVNAFLQANKKLEDITLHMCETRYITICTTIKLAFVLSMKALSGLQYRHELSCEQL